MAELLVSVRSAAEARAALRGGADIIDVKEPQRGALGRADEGVVRAVVEVVRGRRVPHPSRLHREGWGTDRCVPQASSRHGQRTERAGKMPAVQARAGAPSPTLDQRPSGMGHPAEMVGDRAVSVALGELTEWVEREAPRLAGVRYAKVGLATCARHDGWAARWHALRSRLGEATCGQTELIAVAYADHVRAEAPELSAVVDLAVNAQSEVLLVDTWGKDGKGLLEWMRVDTLATLARTCRAGGVRLALAGSLGADSIAKLGAAGPDIVAVRGAACSGGRRDGTVDAEAVKRLAALTRAIDASGSRALAAGIGS